MSLAAFLGGLCCLVLGLLAGSWAGRHRYRRRRLEAVRESVDNLRNQLQKTQRMEALGIICGSLMHNLNNLLAVVIGQARLALGGIQPGTPAWKSMGLIVQAAESAAELSREIDSYQREVDYGRQPVRLQSVVRATVKLLRDIMPDSVRIETEIDPSCGPVLASATQVQQILMNLCSNAHQAMYRRRGRITISLQPAELRQTRKAVPRDLASGSYVTLTVADNGRGMDAETLAQVFEPYFSARAPARGAGLGLTMVARLLEANEGAAVPSSLPGHGSRFDLYFPLIARGHDALRGAFSLAEVPGPLRSPADRKFAADYQTPAAVGLSPAMVEQSARRIHVLLLEDDDMVADMVKTCLHRVGMTVTAIADGARAVTAFATDPGSYDLLLADQFLRGLDGREVIAEIKRLRPRMPVILMSGHPEGILDEEVRRLDINATLAKPFTPAQLIASIRQAMKPQPRADEGRA